MAGDATVLKVEDFDNFVKSIRRGGYITVGRSILKVVGISRVRKEIKVRDVTVRIQE